MALPLMPKATAVWLVQNTGLTFEQIGDFCGLHPLEVQAIADGEVAAGIQPLDPVANGQLAQEEIDRCAANPKERLRLTTSDVIQRRSRKGARYTPVSKRHDRPNAIAWLLRHHPELGDAQICRLIGTTKPTVNAVRDRTHWNAANLRPQSPILLGLCTAEELEKASGLALARAERARKRAEKAASIAPSRLAQPEPQPSGEPPAEGAGVNPAESPSPSPSEPSPVTQPEESLSADEGSGREPHPTSGSEAATADAEPRKPETEGGDPARGEPERAPSGDRAVEQAERGESR